MAVLLLGVSSRYGGIAHQQGLTGVSQIASTVQCLCSIKELMEALLAGVEITIAKQLQHQQGITGVSQIFSN
jgi:hypothetical protein